ncbi:MAG: pyrroline-5-carboxylate reductase [Planctomycetota bacterium]
MKLAFLGAGNMAEAILRGLPDGHEIVAADPSAERREVFELLGATVCEELSSFVEDADVLVLATKPQVAPTVVPSLAGVGDALVVSIMAGVTSATIERWLGGERRVVRVMPNTPVLIGKGMCGMAPGTHATADDLETTRMLFDASAEVVQVEPNQMDAVTAVSGSGPAYLFYLAEHMMSAAEDVGLARADAEALVRRTLLGAAEMLAAGDDPAVLRQRVTSPAGTTAAAIDAFDAADTPAIIRRAVTAARDRGRELSA